MRYVVPILGLMALRAIASTRAGTVSADASCAGTGMLLAVKTVDSHPGDDPFRAHALVAIGSTGQTWAQGTVRIPTLFGFQAIVTDAELAHSRCRSDGTLEELVLALHNPTNGTRALLRVIPDASRLGDARLELSDANGTAQMDGAILVVSAADGPMP